MLWSLCLKARREFSQVVETRKRHDKRASLLFSQPEQTSKALDDEFPVAEKLLSNRGHIQ
jgi:hypothetical protein